MAGFNMNPHQRKPEPKVSGGSRIAAAPPAEPKAGGAGVGGEHTQLHDHGDGTFHSITGDGVRTEHPHIGHALVHIGHHHAGGMHMHAHHDGGGITSHHAAEDGEVQGPHQHPDVEALKEHLGKFFGEEQQEGAPGGAAGSGPGMTGLEE